VRIVIGEDSALFREGLASLISSADHEVVSRAATAATLVSQVRAHEPDIVVTDIRIPDSHEGILAAREIRQWSPTMPILLLSQHIEVRHLMDLASSGAIGYLLKDRVLDVDEFLGALARVAAGGSALDSDVVSRLLSVAHAESILDALTPRELDVLSLMAQGLSNSAISEHLFLSARTVETHCGNIFTKLDLTGSSAENRRVRAILAYLGATRERRLSGEDGPVTVPADRQTSKPSGCRRAENLAGSLDERCRRDELVARRHKLHDRREIAPIPIHRV